MSAPPPPLIQKMSLKNWLIKMKNKNQNEGETTKDTGNGINDEIIKESDIRKKIKKLDSSSTSMFTSTHQIKEKGKTTTMKALKNKQNRVKN
jgi:hypothetical protein